MLKKLTRVLMVTGLLVLYPATTPAAGAQAAETQDADTAVPAADTRAPTTRRPSTRAGGATRRAATQVGAATRRAATQLTGADATRTPPAPAPAAVAAETPRPPTPTVAADPLHSPAQPSGGGAHTAAETKTAAGGHAETGHEKADLLPDPTRAATWASALWVVIIFLVLLIILYPTAWKNVLAGLKAREQRIRNDIAEAEAARAKAEATLREYNTQLATAEQRVREMLAQATVQGEQIANNIRSRAEQEATEARERSLREIESAKKQAVTEIHQYAAILATSAAEKILRRSLKPEDQKDLVQRSLEELQTIGNNR